MAGSRKLFDRGLPRSSRRQFRWEFEVEPDVLEERFRPSGCCLASCWLAGLFLRHFFRFFQTPAVTRL